MFHSSNLLHQHKEATAHWTDDDFEEQTEEDEDEEAVNWDELERLLWRPDIFFFYLTEFEHICHKFFNKSETQEVKIGIII